MKKQLLTVMLFAGVMATSAQVLTGTTTIVSDFENVTLTSDHNKVYNDSTGGGGFTSGNGYFPSKWDTAYGGYWSSGWAASAVYDSATAGYTNLYGCAAYKGCNNSNKFAVGFWSPYGTLTMKMTDSLLGKTVKGMYICNSTYAYKSIKKGDSFEHAFTAKNKDWFKLTIKNYFSGVLAGDSSEVYLADFRYADTTQNYILNNWYWIDLSVLGNTDSLIFSMSSTQNGMYGMNTPAFFCIDNLTLNTQRDTLDVTGIKNYIAANDLNVYPNPAVTETEIAYTTSTSSPVDLKVVDLLGNEIIAQRARTSIGLNKFRIDISYLPTGVYYITLNVDNKMLTKKLIKQ
jgi:hypothetical protein